MFVDVQPWVVRFIYNFVMSLRSFRSSVDLLVYLRINGIFSIWIERFIWYNGWICWVSCSIVVNILWKAIEWVIDRMMVCYMAKLVFTWQILNTCDWRWLCANTQNIIFYFVCATMPTYLIQSDSKNTIISSWCCFFFSRRFLFQVKKTLGIWKRVTPKYFISNFHFKTTKFSFSLSAPA